MDKRGLLGKLRAEFGFLKNPDILGLLLFGSREKDENGRDIDLCIVAGKNKPLDVLRGVWHHVDVYGKGYDIYCFEELPLWMKIQVIENHEIIFSNDKYTLSEYFYPFRRLWDEQKHRNTLKKEEILMMME